MQQAPGAPLGILPPCCFRSQACSSAWAPETPGGLVWAKMRQQGSDPRIHEPRAPDHEGISTASEILSAHIQPNGSAASNARRLGRKHHVSRTVSFRPLQSRMGRRRAAGQEGKRGEGGAEGNREGRCLPGWWSLYLPAMRADRGPGHSRDSIELQLGRHLGIEVASDDGAETAHRARGRAPGHYFFFFSCWAVVNGGEVAGQQRQRCIVSLQHGDGGAWNERTQWNANWPIMAPLSIKQAVRFVQRSPIVGPLR